MVMRFPRTPRDFPPRKDGFLHPASGCLEAPLPLPHGLYGRAGELTLTSEPKFPARIDRLPDLFTPGAPRASL